MSGSGTSSSTWPTAWPAPSDWRATLGSPRHVLEMVQLLRERNLLWTEDGEWRSSAGEQLMQVLREGVALGLGTDGCGFEMHLEAKTELDVHWPGGGRHFAPGERIPTESSYKYDIEGFAHLLHAAGFHHSVAWTDERRWFAVVLATP